LQQQAGDACVDQGVTYDQDVKQGFAWNVDTHIFCFETGSHLHLEERKAYLLVQ
jgi:hypothetical protein